MKLDDKKNLGQRTLTGNRALTTAQPGKAAATKPATTAQTTQTAQRPAEKQATTQSGAQSAAPAQAAAQPAAQSQDTGAVQNAQALLSQQLGGYQSQYGSQISGLVEQLQGRSFEYDVASDPMYQALREQWLRDGNLAMQDTMAQAAQLTGGYGNSYAQMAGQQAYQGYMRGLNEMIPGLKEAARADYDAETAALLQQYSLLMEQDEQDYGRYMDYIAQQNYEQEFAYQQGRDEIADARYEQEWAYQQEQDEKDYALNLALAAYEMGDDSLVKALGINPQEYGVSYGSGGSSGGGSRGSGSGTAGGGGSGTPSGVTGSNAAGSGGSGIKTPQELGDPFAKEDYTHVYANCTVFAGNGATSAEISAYLKEALREGSITQAQYQELMAKFGNLADTGNKGSSGSGGGGGSRSPGGSNRYVAFN